MDFISNLIKRPISLVLNDTSAAVDILPISASLPNTPSELENRKDSENIKNEEQKQNKKNFNQNKNFSHNPLSMSSSYDDDNMTDFIGVPEEFLDEFKDILPPPPLPLQNSYHLTQSLLDMDNTDSLSITPPPPPFPIQFDQGQSLSPSMKVSATIDELLLEISDNLYQAGLNDDVLAIASPPNKSELAKAAFNSSKALGSSSSASNIHINESKITTKAAGSADLIVTKNNSFHQFDNDPKELEAGYSKQQQENEQHLNNSDVNKSSNKFAGLLEFDETKKPELPNNLNSNTEEQYNVTFENNLMPIFEAQQGSIASDELKVIKNHLPSYTEIDAASSDNEAFVDCNDEKDPLETNCAEQDVTTEMESFLSAANKSLSSNVNNAMESITNIAIEADGDLLKNNKNQVTERQKSQSVQPVEVDEPMDVDMNDTMEIVQNTLSNIQHVEDVLQHVESSLSSKTESVTDLAEKQNELSKTASEINMPLDSQSLYIEQSKHEISLNKSVELPINKSKNLNTECAIDGVKKDVAQEENKNKELEPAKEIPNASGITNLSPIDCKNETKLNSNLILNSSMNSQKNSPPNSPTFPIKTAQNVGFPRSPKAAIEKPTIAPFLEKSDYLENRDTHAAEERLIESGSESITDIATEQQDEKTEQTDEPVEVGDTVPQNVTICIARDVEQISEASGMSAIKAPDEKTQCLNLEASSLMQTALEEPVKDNTELKNKRYTFSMDEEAKEKRLTFGVKPNDETDLNLVMQSSSEDKADKRRTFGLPSKATEQIDEPVEVEDTVSQNVTICISTDVEQISEASGMSAITAPDEKTQCLNLEASSLMQTALEEPEKDNRELKNKRYTFSMDEEAKEKRLTFGVKPNDETGLNVVMQSSSEDKTDKRRTFGLPLKPIEQADESMEVEDTVSQNFAISISTDLQQISVPTGMSANLQARAQAPPLNPIQINGKLTPPISDQPTSQPPHLPSTQSNLVSPPILTVPVSKKPLPNMQTVTQISHPTMTNSKSQNQSTPELTQKCTFRPVNIKQEPMSLQSVATAVPSFALQPLSTLIQKRPSIRDARHASAADTLSVKELSNLKVKDEKDVFVEKSTPPPVESIFTAVSARSTTLTHSSGFTEFDQTSINAGEQQFEEQFGGNNNLILNPSDFDYLLTKGNNNVPVDRSSLLLKFDPLLGVPVPVYQGQQQFQHLPTPTNNNSSSLSPPLEEDEHNSNPSLVTDTNTRASAKLLQEKSQEVKQKKKLEQQVQQQNRKLPQEAKKNATMSVDVIKDMSLDNDCNKTYENSNSTQSDVKQNNYKMDELEKKIKNEVLKTDDIEKKLKDAEQREEALIKRVTEKDKTITKMNGVVEAYEKAIAELIADKEQLTQNYEKQLAELKADRDSNYHHLTSLETTFSDLHVKYEKSKEMTCQLKENEESLQAEKRRTLENLHLQEQRYDKMKNHAMQQLEIANKKLESLTREHAIEITKLKVLLKKEEIARSSINEQLAHKTKENTELVKICDELITGQGSNFSFEPYDSKKH